MPSLGRSSLLPAQSFAALLDAMPAAIREKFSLVGDPLINIAGITDDSRAVQPGFCFVAHRGVETDGHAYIPHALAHGASVIVCETGAHIIGLSDRLQQVDPLGSQTSYSTRRTLAVVPDGREAFAWLCSAWHDFPSHSFKVVGITGTDGKTTTGTLLFNILKTAGFKVGLISTVNAVIGDIPFDTGLHTTTPDADDLQVLLGRMRDASVTHCILEVTSHGLAQHRVDGIRFAVGVITNITQDHIDLHGTREAYRLEKARLFELVGPKGTAVLNEDDPFSYDYLSRISVGRQLAYSNSATTANSKTHLVPTGNRLSAQNVVHTPFGLEFNIVSDTSTLPIQSALVGDFNISNILAATAAARALDVIDSAIAAGVRMTTGVHGRMERVDAGQSFLAMVDFAHTPNALENCLTTLNRQKQSGRLIVVFGCAGERDRQKRPLMADIASRLADVAIFTAEDPRRERLESIFGEMMTGVSTPTRPKVRIIPDRFEALLFACTIAQLGDIVVACGKGHEQSMCFGTQERPWDDRIRLKQAIDSTR